MAKKRNKLGEILYRKKIVDKPTLIKAMKKSKASNKRLGETLVEMGKLTEDKLTQALAKQFGFQYVDLDDIEISQSTMNLIPDELIRKHFILPLEQDNGVMKVIISDPQNLDLLDLLRFRLNTEIECCLASPSKIKSRIHGKMDEVRSSIDATTAELEQQGLSLQEEIRLAEANESDDDGPIIRLVNMLIDEATRMDASDIHIEPMADRVRIRYRIDGVCVERDNIPKSMQAPLIARTKIISGMDIGERRLPQDGRIKRTIDGQDIDFRVSALPGYHGESTVLRILRPENVNIGIQALGFEQDNYEKFQQIIKRPNGIFLVTGPTGSGKTTTLYSALKELNRPDIKIITAEDPVEYNVAGINQCQIRTEIDLSFEKILRSMLRQAPDIILIGEIRDGIVADIAIQAALTGHLVFSTLHTNDAPSAITRLIDMGVKPFLAASSIQAIMAQRLLRVICKQCKVVNEHPDPNLLRLLNITPSDIKKNPIYKGAGCSRCQGTGYKGRIAIFEMLEMNNQIRELAFSRAPAIELRKAARNSGMRTLLEDGKLKVFKGITTLEEVAKKSQADGLVLDV
ncbi:MAG: type II/IV secretion system protein [Planctomycetes bacterium]|nr:type II/IV secretion system protein [Planctomycetota bacterium]